MIASTATPRARLVPLTGGSGIRKSGVWRAAVISDDFDALLPAELLRGFSGDDTPDQTALKFAAVPTVVASTPHPPLPRSHRP